MQIVKSTEKVSHPHVILAAAKKYPDCLGVFTTRGEMWWAGRPVHTNTRGRLLHHGGGNFGWVIGRALGSAALRGFRAHHSPESEDNWRCWTGSEYRLASVTVTATD